MIIVIRCFATSIATSRVPAAHCWTRATQARITLVILRQLRRCHRSCVGMDCGILFSTYDLLISSKSLGKEAKAQLKAAKLAEKAKLQQGKDDGDADKIQFGAA